MEISIKPIARKILAILVLAGVSKINAVADQRWDFSQGTQGWGSASATWSGSISSGGKTINGFAPGGEAAISDGKLGASGGYMSSPTDFNDWERYIGGSLNIKMSERTAGDDYHNFDDILGGGSGKISTTEENSGRHPQDIFPYVFMKTTVDGTEMVLAAQLLFTEGETTRSITFDADTWMQIDVTLSQDGWGDPFNIDLTINGSFLSAEQFAEAMANCEGIFVRGEYSQIGGVGGGELDYLSLLEEVWLMQIPEPGAYASIFGLLAILAAFVYRRNRKN